MPVDPLRQANAQYYVQHIQRGAIPQAVTINMLNNVGRALRELGKEVTPKVRRMGEALIRKGIPPSKMRAANMKLALGAQAAIVAGWRSTLPENAPPYRQGPRLSGALGQALGSSEMTRATTDRTISFLNEGALNTEARHWYRVNYGALGPKVAPARPRAFPVTVDGHSLLMLQDQAPPAPASWLPQVLVAEKPVWFAPVRGPANVEGGGSRAALFTDLGFEYVANNFGRVYKEMFHEFVNEQMSVQQSKEVKVHVRVVT
jgi:hypothetical protein